MRTQATRLTRKEAAYWDYWTDRGYRFQPGEKPPLTTQVAPTRVIKHPIRDCLMGLAVIVGALSLVGLWIAHGAKLI